MTETITDSILLLYHFHELSANKAAAVKNSLKNDFNLQMRYEQLISPLNDLSSNEAEPDDTSLAIIMEHAAKMHDEVAAD